MRDFCIYDDGRKLKSFCLQSLSFWEICKCVSVCRLRREEGEPARRSRDRGSAFSRAIFFAKSVNRVLHVLSFLKRKYERKQFERHIPSKAPLKSSRRGFSAPSALPKQRRKYSSELKMLLIVQSFCIYDDGRKLKSFCLHTPSFWEICKCVSVCRLRRDRLDMPGKDSFFKALPPGELPTESGERVLFAYFRSFRRGKPCHYPLLGEACKGASHRLHIPPK